MTTHGRSSMLWGLGFRVQLRGAVLHARCAGGHSPEAFRFAKMKTCCYRLWRLHVGDLLSQVVR